MKMGDAEIFAILVISITAILIGGVLIHEDLWVNQANDYTRCLASCTNNLDSHVTPQELQCVEACESLSECKEGLTIRVRG